MDTRSIVHHEVVVDIVPASRHGSESDVANVTSTALYAAGPAEQDGEQQSRERLDTQRYTVDVNGTDDDTFTFTITVPEEGRGSLVKNGSFSLVVLLPPPSVFEGEPLYEVELRTYTKDPLPRVFRGFDLPVLGNRIGLAWYARVDPEMSIEYVYRRVS